MNADVWKITINLRKKGNPVVTVAGRGPMGNTLRTGGLVTQDRPVALVVGQAFETFDEFDEVAMEAVRRQANKEALSQRAEQAQKEPK